MTNPVSAILKFICGKNDCRTYLREAIDYITDPVKTENGQLVFTQGCSPKNAVDDMFLNKLLHHKTGGKQGIHCVFAFPPSGNARSPADILNVTRNIVSTVYPEFLAVMAVHTDSRVLHSHVILDSVNAVTGKKFSQGPGDLNRVKQKVNGILKAHGFEIIRASPNDFVDYTDYSRVAGFDFLELDETKLLQNAELISESDITEIIPPSDLLTADEFAEVSRRLHGYRINPYTAFGGAKFMKKTNDFALRTQQPQETPAPLLVEQAVPTAAAPSCYPTTTVATGPTIRIKGTPQSELAGLGELVTQTARFAQEHQLEAANLALAMQSKAQEMGLPTNVSVIAGPIIDIDLCNRFDDEDDVVYGDYGD